MIAPLSRLGVARVTGSLLSLLCGLLVLSSDDATAPTAMAHADGEYDAIVHPAHQGPNHGTHGGLWPGPGHEEGPPPNHDVRPVLTAGLALGASPQQLAAEARLRVLHPDLRVEYDPATGVARKVFNVTGLLGDPRPGVAPMAVALDFVAAHRELLGLTEADITDFEVTDVVPGMYSGSTHIYLRQMADNLPVYNGVLQINVAGDGRIVSVNNAFVPDLANLIAGTPPPALSATQAVHAVRRDLGIAPSSPSKVVRPSDKSPRRRTVLDVQDVSQEPIDATLMWLPVHGGDVRQSWNMQVHPPDRPNVYDVTVDAATSEVLTRFDWTAADSYRVYPLPAESPIHHLPLPPTDGRVTIFDPAHPIASPFGWHDTNGAPGPEFTIMRGNNVHAYDDRDANNAPPGVEPDCGAGLNCGFGLNLTLEPVNYTAAAITNLFYWNNIVHDVQERYGFTSAAGNFQANTYGMGGIGGDAVRAEAQDGSGTNNANFFTPPDGSPPRMQMFEFTSTVPRRDSDLDAGVIVHEYGHGISTRLVGGPGNSSCLGNPQQAGEGLSDWWALAYTATAADTGAKVRGIGTYVLGQPTTGGGIRAQPYSTDPAVNTWTYASVAGMSVPHGVGSVWAQAAWEAYWALVDVHGFSGNLYDAGGGAGNQRMMLYVNEGLKMTPCSPAFTDVRDGIIQAAAINYDGEDVCRLWDAFADFGLGADAISGGPNGLTPQNGFAVPPTCAPDLAISKAASFDVDAGEEVFYDIEVCNLGPGRARNVVVTDILPPQVRFIASSAPGVACSVTGIDPGTGGQIVTCDVGDLPDNMCRHITLKTRSRVDAVATEADGAISVVNTATVSASSPDGNVLNNTAQASTFIQERADLRITKFIESTHDPIRAGETFTYTIFVDNLGPSVARGVTISDTFLSSNKVQIQRCAFSVSQGGGMITQFTCTTGGVVSTQFGTNIGTFSTDRLDPVGVVGSPPPVGGHQGRLRASFRLVMNTGGQVTNTARVTARTPDPDTSNNFTSVDRRAISVSNLAVTKTATGEEQQTNQAGLMFNNAVFSQVFPTVPNYFASTRVTAGRRIQYRLVVSNSGPSPAENVVLHDRLPAGVRIYQGSLVATYGGPPVPGSPAPPPGANCDTGTPGEVTDELRCGLGLLNVGQSYTLVFEVITDSWLPPGTVLENDAWVTSDTLDVHNANNMAFTQNTVLGAADLSALKTAVGQVISGFSTTTGQFAVIDSTTSVVAGMELRYQVQLQNNGPSDTPNAVFLDRLPALFGAPAQPPVTFLRAVGADCRPDRENNLQLFCNAGPLRAGERTTVDIYVRVHPAVPQGSLLTNCVDVLTGASNTIPPGPPPGLPTGSPELVVAWDPLGTNNTNICVNTSVLAVSDAGGPGNDPSLLEDNAISKVDVPAEPRLDKPFEPDDAIAGNEHRYLISFGTAGPSVATGVQVIDTLDVIQAAPLVNGETYVRCEAVDAVTTVTCVAGPGAGQVRLQTYNDPDGAVFVGGTGTLNPGKVYRFHLVTRVIPGYVLDAPDNIARDTVAISTTTTDPNAANNADSEDTRIISEADLAASLTDTPPLATSVLGAAAELDVAFQAPGFLTCDPVAPGGTVFFEGVVRNLGPSDARGVLLNLQLPAGLVLDPSLVGVTVSAGQVLEIRDDGRLVIAIGNDPITPGVIPGGNQLGRLNAGNFVTVRIEGTVALSAACGTDLVLQATVQTVPTYDALLNGANEVPPVVTGATGTATLFLDPATRELFTFLSVNNIDNLTAAHIHLAPPGVNGPVIVTLWEAGDGPFGPGAPITNVSMLTADQVLALNTGRLYINVHTTDFPGGEIRGQIVFDVGTPTLDPNLANNFNAVSTRIECPRIQVIKTVSFDGKCPGVSIGPGVFNQTGRAVTFCFEVTNTGTTFLDDIFLTDTLTTRSAGATEIYTTTITSGLDPNRPVAPGETVLRQVTVPQLLKDWSCGVADDVVTVTANPVNSGRTDLSCLPDVTDTDTARINVPCAGVDWRLQLPILSNEGCVASVEVQNVGDAETKALMVVWGTPGACPPQSAGPLKVECTGLIAPGSAWHLRADQMPVGANSAVVYSLSTDIVTDYLGQKLRFADLACLQISRRIVGDHEWWLRFDTAYRTQDTFYGQIETSGAQFTLDFKKHQGEPIAAVVNRGCPDVGDPNVTSWAAYTSVSSDQEGARDPVFGGYTYYTPLVFANKGGLNSRLHIHNSGDECSSIELWLRTQDVCLRNQIADVLSLAPGETVSFDPNTAVGPDWLGNAWISASQPLGIVVDTKGPNHFTSYNGVPADVYSLDFSYGDPVNFAPLVYSEYQGWDAALQVQNLSAVHAAKVKVYFLDRSGGIVTTLVDWICARGSQTYFLPVIAALPGNWVGSARAESQEWLSPGSPNVLAVPISTVVTLEKWSDPARTTRREAIAYNAQSECLLYDWQLGHGLGGTQSGSAVFALPMVSKGNRGVTTEIAITNLVPKPGFTDFAIFIYDQNHLIDYVCQKLNQKQVEYINLATWGWIDNGFYGSAVVSAVFWEHDVFDGRGRFERNLVGLGGVGVERIGGVLGGADVPGDESKGWEAFPIFDYFRSPVVPRCPGVPGGFGGR